MSVCIYCLKDKPDSEMTLEHVIPQFLGGQYAPRRYQTRRSCQRCNHDLGLFVDASFARTWLVSNWLQNVAMSSYDPNKPVGLPLACMGIIDNQLPGMAENEVCELHIGPLGEAIFWVRPHDERLYWYVGGNPRTTKTIRSRAYYFFSERSPLDLKATLLAFKESFSGHKVTKIFATEVPDEFLNLGFLRPDTLDAQRIAILRETTWSKRPKVRASMNVEFDKRFLAKLARGISFCLFGDKVLHGRYANEIQKALWYRPNDPPSGFMSAATLGTGMPGAEAVLGHSAAIVIAINFFPNLGIAASVNIGARLGSSAVCMTTDSVTAEDIARIECGLVIAIFPNQHESLQLPLLDYILHRTGQKVHTGLAALEAVAARGDGHFYRLAQMPAPRPTET